MIDTYPISSRDYLNRAQERLGDGTYQSLFYAAFELRCGIEARMQEYMENWSHISENKKKGWKISKLGKDLEKAFRTGDKVVRWEVLNSNTCRPIACFYHTPVTKSLQQKGGRLGEYLHAMKKVRPSDDPWWEGFREILVDAFEDLQIANTGTLFGPPMQREGSNQVQMNMEIPPGIDANLITLGMEGSSFTVDVKYLDELPDPLESEAIVWRR